MLKRAVKSVLHRFGYNIVRSRGGLPLDFTDQQANIIRKVQPYTATNAERIGALIEAVKHVVRHGIAGSFVECGVYKGGSVMAMALTLLELDVTEVDLYLFDTFAGMPEPQDIDVDIFGNRAVEEFRRTKLSPTSSTWVNASLAEVQAAMGLVAYPPEKIHYVKGMVEDTVPTQAPESIALLRLDTDLYQSTQHEMRHLYPRVSAGGIVIIDDYGCFAGTRQAVDEYFADKSQAPFLNRIDATARLIVKP